jgi:hypothetical protein
MSRKRAHDVVSETGNQRGERQRLSETESFTFATLQAGRNISLIDKTVPVVRPTFHFRIVPLLLDEQ